MTTATIPDHILPRLKGEGVSARWLAEQMGIPLHDATRLLRAAGCVPGKKSRYYISGTRPALMTMPRQCFQSAHTGVTFGAGDRQ